MSIIEQAYKRLEELNRAGISVPVDGSTDVPNSDRRGRRLQSSAVADVAPLPPSGAPIVDMLRHRASHENVRTPSETAKRVSRAVELDLTRLS